MSWSLELRNGDFTAGAARLGTVTRHRKLFQDLRCAVLERMGTDNLHPGYGSLIDGGRSPDGVEHPGVIGETDLQMIVLEIESEIHRISRNLQRQQLARAKQDHLTYGKPTLEPAEVLVGVSGIDFYQREDVLKVTVTVQTASDDSWAFEIPIEIPLDSVNQ